MFGETNSNSFPPVRGDDLMPSLSLWTRLGGVFLVGTVVSAVSLALVIKYKVTVEAPATVRPTGDLRVVQAATEGTIENIEVQENQQVKQGDVTAVLDDSSLSTQRSQLQEKISQSQQQLVQIAAQLKALSQRINSESRLMERSMALAKANLALSRREHQDQQATTAAEMEAAQAEMALAKEELKRYQQLAETGAVAQLQIEEKQQAFNSAQAKVKSASAMLNPDRASVDMAQEQMAQAKFRGESAIATLNQEKETLVNTQIEIQNQLNRDHTELQHLERELEKTKIKAPLDGEILQLQLRNPGQVVKVGDPIAQIAPQNAPLVVKARVAAQDISKVRLCTQTKVAQCKTGKVKMRFSAYPYPDYGVLSGAVRATAADAIAPQTNDNNSDRKNAAANAPYYEVTIEPEKSYFTKNGKKYPIQAGMEVTANIIAREETVMTFLLRKARLISDL